MCRVYLEKCNINFFSTGETQGVVYVDTKMYYLEISDLKSSLQGLQQQFLRSAVYCSKDNVTP